MDKKLKGIKVTFLVVIASALMAFCAIALCGCFSIFDSHYHTYSSEYSYDEECHWRDVTCGHDVMIDKYEHVFNEDFECTVCKYAKVEDPLFKFEKRYSYPKHEVVGYDCAGFSDEQSKKDVTEIEIPATHFGLPVTGIANGAFSDTALVSVIIPDGITGIKNSAFYGCSALESVKLPEGIITIYENAFVGCASLSEISLSSVRYVEARAFSDCVSLNKIDITNASEIGDEAFSGCTALTEVLLYDYILKIGDNVFSKCDNIEYNLHDGIFYLGNDENPYVGIFGSETNIYEADIPLGNRFIYTRAFQNRYNLMRVALPSSTKIIKTYAFSGCPRLVEVCNGSTLTIKAGDSAYGNVAYNALHLYRSDSGASAFDLDDDGFAFLTTASETYLVGYAGEPTEISLPNTHNGARYAIFHDAFSYNDRVTSVVIPSNVKSIENGAFAKCSSLESITVPYVGMNASQKEECEYTMFSYIFGHVYTNSSGKVTSFEDNAPASLKHVTVTGGKIFANAFRNSKNIETVTITGATLEGERIFYNCASLKTVTLPNNLTALPAYTFYNCTALEEVEIPSGVTTILATTFQYSGLLSVTVPDSVKTIEKGAFCGCTRLEEMTLPFVGESASANGASLSTLFGHIFYGDVNSSAFYGVYQEYIAQISVNGLKSYIPLSLKSVTITGGKLFYGAFMNCKSLETVVLPDHLEEIPENAFYCCTSLRSIKWPSDLYSIKRNAFYYCTFEEITVPDSVGFIERGAFEGCNKLIEITLPFVGARSYKSETAYDTVFGYIFGGTIYDNSAYRGSNLVYQYYNRVNVATGYWDGQYHYELEDCYYFYYIPETLRKVTITGGNIVGTPFLNCDFITEINLPPK